MKVQVNFVVPKDNGGDDSQKYFDHLLILNERDFADILFERIEEMPNKCAKVRVQRRRENVGGDSLYIISADVYEWDPYVSNCLMYQAPKADYSAFPFDTLTIPMIASLFIESKKLGDGDFADACLKQLQTRKE